MGKQVCGSGWLPASLKCQKIWSDYIERNAVFTRFEPGESWAILSPIEQSIKRKIEAAGKPLREWDVRINYGIKTGFNEAFIINGAKKDELIAQDPKSAEIIRPILRGKDIKRYGYNFADLWIIATFPSRHYDIDQYPAVKNHLLSFGMERLEQTGKTYKIDGKVVKARKKTNNKWFETQDSIGYWDDFNKQKIIYPNMTKFLPFYLDDKSFFINDKCFMLVGNHLDFLCSFLNSPLFRFCFINNFPSLGDDRREMRKIFFDKIPVIQISDEINKKFNYRNNELLADKQSNSLNALIYKIYNLTCDEIELVENFLK